MNLVKHKIKEDIYFNTEECNYIEPYWLDIKEDKQTVGILTGYRLHIPLLLNDLLTDEFSFIEFDEISQLCSILWSYLSENVELLLGRNGYLYFLNNVHIYEQFFNREKELQVLKLLENKYEIIIFSSGQTELFDDYFINDTDENYWADHDVRLIENGWEKDFEYEFLIKSCERNSVKRYKNFNHSSIKNFPFEHWVKSKGIEWIKSMWSGILKQPRYNETWSKIKYLHNENTEECKDSGSLNPTHFLKKFTIKDFKQYDPESGYISSPPPYAKNLRDEGLFIQFKRKKYAIFLNQDLLEYDEERLNIISIGVYDEVEETYVIGNDPFDDILFSWMETFFIDLFKRVYSQYEVETDLEEDEISIFKSALEQPILISNRKTSIFKNTL